MSHLTWRSSKTVSKTSNFQIRGSSRSLNSMENSENLIFVPGPGMGHVVSAVQIGKLILSRDTRLSITYLLIKDPQAQGYIQSLKSQGHIPRLQFLNLKQEFNADDGIIRWLDDQPWCSVVFLCFGSQGSFSEAQIKQVAIALERTGFRFLWSLRRPSPVRKTGSPDEMFPEGFLERTRGVGKVIGWAPQVAILSHPVVGGFVSHCGWNSILESLWFGVPIAAWPMYAEQQVNAFQMVVELGVGVEIKMDYRDHLGDEIVVSSYEIEKGIMKLMTDREIREKVKDMQENSRKALREGGSSYKFLGCLINDILHK